MPRISISFDPSQDTEEEVFAHVAAIYGVEVAPVALREADRPDTGAGAPAPGADTPALGLDSEGLPWDDRIHAKSQTKVADGTWRKGKNLAAGVYDGIVAELRKTYPALSRNLALPGMTNVTSAGTASIAAPNITSPTVPAAIAPSSFCPAADVPKIADPTDRTISVNCSITGMRA